MVCDLGGVLKAVGLHQHHLQLGGGVDVDHLVAPAGLLGLEEAGGGVHLGGLVLALAAVGPGNRLEIVLKIILVLILIGPGEAL